MIYPMIFHDHSAASVVVVPQEHSKAVLKEEIETPDIGVNFDFFTSDKAKSVKMDNTSELEEKQKRTPRKKSEGITIAAEMVGGTPKSDIAKSYDETNNLLRATIAQTDMLSQDVSNDIKEIRASKTIKNKYTYLTNLSASASSIIQAKIQAIRELNSSIKNINDAELRRAKELKELTEGNDDMKMMQMYSAFVNTPIGAYQAANGGALPPMPSMSSIMVAANEGSGDLVNVDVNTESRANYLNTRSPEQNRMILDSDPNVKTVVVYNQDNDIKYFDVVNVTTGQSVPNVAKPSDFILKDTTIDIFNGVARNRNIEETWPLVVVGTGKMKEF